MKIVHLSLLFILWNCSQAQVLLKLKNDSLFSYLYTGGDEFNTSTLNENNWKSDFAGLRIIMAQDLSFSPKKIELKNGLINFIANKEDSNYVLYDREVDSAFLKKQKLKLKNNEFTTKYAAGGIISKSKFHYGFYEISFKVEEGRGVWPAFWFYGGNKNEEIDVFELKCEKNNEIHVDTHCPYGCDKGYKNNLGIKTSWGGWMPVSDYLHEGFNIMALEWKENELFWYINGFPLAYFKGSFPNPMNLFLNTSVAKDGGAFPPGPDETTVWPNTYSVDYFRSWQPLGQKDVVFLKANDNFTSSEELSLTKQAKPKKTNGYIYKKKKVKQIEGFIFLSRTSSDQLCIRVLGKLKQKGLSLTIKSNSANKTFIEFEKEIKMHLAKEDKDISILITNNNKQYVQKILLSNEE